jgi:protein TonB
MEDIKRLIFPAIAAFVLHGFLITLDFPEREKLKPVLRDNSIKIEINTVSRQAVIPDKKEETKKTPANETQNKFVQERVIVQKKELRKQIKKRVEPERTEKKVKVLSEVPQEIIDKPPVQQKTAETPHENIGNKHENQPKEKRATVSLPKKAIPIYRQNKQPLYPAMAKRRGYEGVVLLTVLVNIEGKVSELKIKNPSGHHSLDRSAIETVKNWLFLPASEGDRPVSMWVDIPIVFQLR